MNHLERSEGEKHEYYDGAVRVTEFNFDGSTVINDAEITLTSRYPAEGYAVNDIVTALISVEDGNGAIETKGSGIRQLVAGDRLLVKPGEAYYFTVIGKLVIRYIATPAWTPDQSRIIES